MSLEPCTVNPLVIGAALINDLLERQPDVLSTIRSLGAVQIDPVSIVAPNHHLVLGCRVDGYSPAALEAVVNSNVLLELYAHERCFVPLEDFPIYWPKMIECRRQHQATYESHSSTVRSVLSQIAANGPMSARNFEGNRIKNQNCWGPRKETTKILDLLWQGGYLAVARRQGTEKFYDLIENIIPDSLLESHLTPDEAQALRWERYIKAVRLTDVNDSNIGFKRSTAAYRKSTIRQFHAEGKLKYLQIEGVQRKYVASPDFNWEVSASNVQQPMLVPPLDNLLWRRVRLVDLWGFSYRWEIYTPPSKRSVGAYGMPLVACNRILGQVDAQFDRENSTLTLRAISPLSGVSLSTYMDNLEEAGVKLAHRLGASHVVQVVPFSSHT